MKDLVLLKCIGDETRLKILKTLIKRERCVCEIMSSLNVEQTLVSHHLKVLRSCGVLKSRREGKKIFYEISDKRIVELLETIEMICKKIRCEACNDD
jgi:DNA-binding transcriptional ArsR family regulator